MKSELRAVAYLHEEHEDLGLLGPALKKAGFAITRRYREARRDDLDADLLVVMGGSMGVYELEAHPFLREEQGILMERLAADKANLGICLGGQLLASAAGAEVFPGKNGFEVGVHPLRWTKAAETDPVFKGMRPKFPVVHWHGDTFTPVEGAVLLASTDRYTQQAFRLGKSYGIQFHPELTAAKFEHWLELSAESLEAKGMDPKELRSQVGKLRSMESELTELSERLAFYFAEGA